MTDSLDVLNRRFGLKQALQFTLGKGGLPVAEVLTPLGNGCIALQGAQVLDWQPVGQLPVIWVSKAAQYAAGKAVRGGVPVCWPWFGAREGLPAHGFARTCMWQVRGTSQRVSGEVVLRLGLTDNVTTRALWDFAFDLELAVTMGTSLSLVLTTRNTGHQAFTLTQALHTYFCVNDITQTQIQGLDNCNYLDKVQNFARHQQTGAVTFTDETDRVYIDTTSDCLIDDRAAQRRVRVAKSGSTSTVVWNPWSERERALADMTAGAYKTMVCVETCNTGPDQISLLPAGLHSLGAIISVA